MGRSQRGRAHLSERGGAGILLTHSVAHAFKWLCALALIGFCLFRAACAIKLATSFIETHYLTSSSHPRNLAEVF